MLCAVCPVRTCTVCAGVRCARPGPSHRRLTCMPSFPPNHQLESVTPGCGACSPVACSSPRHAGTVHSAVEEFKEAKGRKAKEELED